jgi:hypothetical protein
MGLTDLQGTAIFASAGVRIDSASSYAAVAAPWLANVAAGFDPFSNLYHHCPVFSLSQFICCGF